MQHDKQGIVSMLSLLESVKNQLRQHRGIHSVVFLETSDEKEGSRNPGTFLEPILSGTKKNLNVHYQKGVHQSGVERSHMRMTARPSLPGNPEVSYIEDDERHIAPAKCQPKSCDFCGHHVHHQTKRPI
jgi:hypothetical protein